MTCCGQKRAERLPDEAGTAGDEDSHAVHPKICLITGPMRRTPATAVADALVRRAAGEVRKRNPDAGDERVRLSHSAANGARYTHYLYSRTGDEGRIDTARLGGKARVTIHAYDANGNRADLEFEAT